MTGDREEELRDAYRTRREVLSDRYVDDALRDQSPESREWQDFVTMTAWGTWARGTLSRRDRSILVLGILASLGRTEELRLHFTAAGRNGLTRADLEEVVRQVAVYAGMPAGVAARRELITSQSESSGDEPSEDR